MENHLHIDPEHRVQSQRSDFIFVLLSIIVDIYVTGVISFTLVNIWETVDLHFIVFASNNLFLLKLLCVMLRLLWYSMQAVIGLLFTHSIIDSSNIPIAFLGEKELNIVPRHICNYFTWTRVSIPSKSFFASAIIKPSSIGAIFILVTNVILNL